MVACFVSRTTHSVPNAFSRATWVTCLVAQLQGKWNQVSSVTSVTRTCSADETWTGEETDCVAVKCEAIYSPANGNMVCSKKRDFGSVCTISCDSGFDLVGPRQRACGAEGRWSGLPPSCQLIHCGPLTGMNLRAPPILFTF